MGGRGAGKHISYSLPLSEHSCKSAELPSHPSPPLSRQPRFLGAPVVKIQLP